MGLSNILFEITTVITCFFECSLFDKFFLFVRACLLIVCFYNPFVDSDVDVLRPPMH